MATFKNNGLQPKHMAEMGNGNIYADKASVTGTGTSGDLIIPLMVPGGNEITDLDLVHDDLDSGTGALAFKVGYRYLDGSTSVVNPDGSTGPDDDYFFATGSTFLRAAGRTRSDAKPLRVDKDIEIVITITTTAAGASAGDVHAIAKAIGHGIR